MKKKRGVLPAQGESFSIPPYNKKKKNRMLSTAVLMTLSAFGIAKATDESYFTVSLLCPHSSPEAVAACESLKTGLLKQTGAPAGPWIGTYSARSSSAFSLRDFSNSAMSDGVFHVEGSVPRIKLL